ncbi:hypothetical protein ACSX1A_10980 [Pontibacter sp. MBLB2868]|uniref:hypothetical protein n=1 Tax=Pontibacter sp. MBLB2868 TaxID=3451555 RepID=UPI003F7543F3
MAFSLIKISRGNWKALCRLLICCNVKYRFRFKIFAFVGVTPITLHFFNTNFFLAADGVITISPLLALLFAFSAYVTITGGLGILKGLS